MVSPAIVILASGSSILSIDGSFLFIFVLIICLIFVLNRTLFRPITKILEDRDRLGVGRSLEAQRMLKQSEERTRDYEARIRAARSAAYKQVEARRRELKAQRQELMAQAKRQAEVQIAAARQQIADQAAIARATLEGDAREMAAGISAQLLRRPVVPGGVGA
ncbi:MAG: hypothetical protein ABI882_04905 [Acidobacteriota bacterium]